ncbi:hypothetical protein GYMLUDRAFT_65456 [Collybiopsis luxurians FD-317 M1]|uniref:Uncharacterized protein n=1 Tax=Collybiopsis luxurians FD-317 M1 TaxID=944289 RepID=A0A0D0BKR1_9AGAR|nr:hypothetical protein GYMLUDRAFT_65456 [Collybiopsis luxurians FD-317 M1]
MSITTEIEHQIQCTHQYCVVQYKQSLLDWKQDKDNEDWLGLLLWAQHELGQMEKSLKTQITTKAFPAEAYNDVLYLDNMFLHYLSTSALAAAIGWNPMILKRG